MIDLIYPQICGICGKINEKYLCNKCKIELNKYAVFNIEKIENRYFKKHLYMFYYEGIIRNNLLKYKFKEEAYKYRCFVNFLLNNEIFFEKIKTYDIIIPVPISKKRLKDRGYNQSYLIAKGIVNNIKIKEKNNIKVENNCLIKSKNVIEQSKLTKEQRIQNVKDVYDLKNENRLTNKRILIVDDIYTTGSTVNECARMLIKANARDIDVLTIAKD